MPVAAQYEVAMAGKKIQADKVQGQQSLQLIEAASKPANTGGHGDGQSGTHLDIVA